MPRGVRPGRHPFEELCDLRGNQGQRYRDPDQSLPELVKRQLTELETALSSATKSSLAAAAIAAAEIAAEIAATPSWQ